MTVPTNFEMILRTGDPDACIVRNIKSSDRIILLWDNKKNMDMGITNYHTRTISFEGLYEFLKKDEIVNKYIE